ncbi:topoisomerase II [Shimwellia pseudoproteus]|uniref:topoisomerase II n=1 Tax=Shimwellia pseudoproteus TaxID=570012 RepID=UPI0018EA7529|nr:topoisomerase II [Shimwellia pseudoproteus]MBJ3814151.1 topoisomerase II [Shimwellia pseudoproteus]
MNGLPAVALSGLILLLMVYILVRKRPAGVRFSALAITLVVVIGGAVLLHRPQPITEHDPQVVGEPDLNTTPLYQAIHHHEPEVWQQLQRQIDAMHQNGQDEQARIDALQQQVLRISVQRLQLAPDAETVAYMRANMDQTAQLQKLGGETCFRFLYPEVRGGINPVLLLTRQQIAQRMNADVAMYNASFGPHAHQVTPQEREQAHRDIQPIVRDLMDKYGDDFDLLARPRDASGKETEMCNMVQDLWHQVFALPEKNAAAVIRYSVAAGSGDPH